MIIGRISIAACLLGGFSFIVYMIFYERITHILRLVPTPRRRRLIADIVRAWSENDELAMDLLVHPPLSARKHQVMDK